MSDKIWSFAALSGAAVAFGFWQESIAAGVFAFCVLDLVSPLWTR